MPNPNATSTTPPEDRFQFGPTKVDVDESVVLPLRQNPKSARYPVGQIRDASDACNRAYTGILATLQQAFDGAPDKLNLAITMMTNQLKPAAITLTTFDLGDGTRASPTFEYLK